MYEKEPIGGDKPERKTESPFDEETTQDIIERCKGNPAALRALADLAQRGKEIYDKVAPNLGEGVEVAIKFQLECNFNLDQLIEKYGK